MSTKPDHDEPREPLGDDAENERIESACERLALGVATLKDTSRPSPLELMASVRGWAGGRAATDLVVSDPSTETNP